MQRLFASRRAALEQATNHTPPAWQGSGWPASEPSLRSTPSRNVRPFHPVPAYPQAEIAERLRPISEAPLPADDDGYDEAAAEAAQNGSAPHEGDADPPAAGPPDQTVPADDEAIPIDGRAIPVDDEVAPSDSSDSARLDPAADADTPSDIAPGDPLPHRPVGVLGLPSLPTRRSQIGGGFSIGKSALLLLSERRLRSKAPPSARVRPSTRTSSTAYRTASSHPLPGH